MKRKEIENRIKELSQIIHVKRGEALKDCPIEDFFKVFDSCCEEETKELDELSRQLRNHQEPKMKEISNNGDHMTLEEFIECCKSGGFIDYDGSGNYATEDKQSDITILPSDIMAGEYRNDFTHVVWYNR